MSKPRWFVLPALLLLLLAVAGCSLFEGGDPTAERPTLAFDNLGDKKLDAISVGPVISE